jgi:MFS family permease
VTGEWSRGWRPLVGGFAGMAVGWNATSVMLGLFIKPMQAEFGWSRTELSAGPMAALIVAGILPFSGAIIDRFGSRLVAIVGLLALTSAWLGFSVVPARHGLFIAAVVWLGIAGGFSNSVVFARGVIAWFTRNLGLSIGLMMSGASCAAALGVPILSAFVARHGWRAGFQAMAVATILIGLPLVLLCFREPPAHSASSDRNYPARDSWRKILSTGSFWKLVAASGVAALPIGGYIGHLLPLLTDRGMSERAAAAMVSLFAVAVAIGRVSNGLLMDRLHPPAVTFGTLALAAIGSAGLAWLDLSTTAAPVVALAALLIGLAQGAEGDYIKFFSMRLFNFANFARVVALLATTISLGMSAGGLLFARVFDHFGSYEPAVIASSILYVVGGALFLTLRMHQGIAQASIVVSSAKG